jgi:hypothetical protein
MGQGFFDDQSISHEFEAQHTNNAYKDGPCVDVFFAGSGFRTDMDLGGAPLMNLTRDFVRDGGGSLMGMNNRVTLTGKIFPSGGGLPGMKGVMSKERQLRDLFRRSAGDLKVKDTDSNTVLFSGIQAKIQSYSANNTPDNMSMSLDYNIELEFFEETTESPEDQKNFRVNNVSENWSIEPQEMIYSSLVYNVTKQPETEPSQSADGGNGFSITKNVKITGIPQYRITRQLSAVGVPSSGFANHLGKAENGKLEYNHQSATQNTPEKYDAYLNAKKWVDDRSKLAFNSTKNDKSYSPFLTLNESLTDYNDIHLYNHTKTVNFSVIDGTYETNDSWVAIPCGILFTEEFTIETSTDEKYVSTVNVQGSVNGLSVTPFNQTIEATGIPTTGTAQNRIKFGTDANKDGMVGTQSNTGHEHYNTLQGAKYENAISGFLNDVKPRLYERACLVVNTPDRTQDYIPSQGNIFTENPGNPAFRKQRRLNYIPVSTSEGHDPLKGIITYSHQYTNKTKIFSGVIAESVDISVNGPGDVISEAFVIGRPLGPVLQNLNTRTSTTKSVNIEITVVPPSSAQGFLLDQTQCPVYTGSQLFQQIEDLVEGLKPYGQAKSTVLNFNRNAHTGNVFIKSNTYNWNPAEGKYSRSVEWVYQPCQLNGQLDRYFLGR